MTGSYTLASIANDKSLTPQMSRNQASGMYFANESSVATKCLFRKHNKSHKSVMLPITVVKYVPSRRWPCDALFACKFSRLISGCVGTYVDRHHGFTKA